jgi:hypothetical protein
MEMTTESATEFQLKNVRWQFFATFTWRNTSLGSVASRESNLWNFFRKISEDSQISLMKVPIVVRWEKGELGLRPHAHALLTGLPPSACNIGQAFTWAAEWNQSQGFAQIKLVAESQEQNPFTYLLKGRDEGHGHRYELRKFDGADRITVSTAAHALFCRNAGVAYFPQLRTA